MPPRAGSLAKRLAPWLVAAAILGFLFATIPFHEVLAAVRRAAPGRFVALCVGFVAAMLTADSFATWVAYRRTLPDAPLGFAETFALRAATYLLAIVHYGVGQGGLAYAISRRHNVPLARAAGATLVNLGVNILMVALAAGCGIALGGAPPDPRVALLVFGLAAAFPIYLLVVGLRPGFLARRGFLAPVFAAGVRGHLVCAAARLPHIAVLLVGHYLAMRLFNVNPSLGTAVTLLPVVFVIANLPVSPLGLGTGQAAAVALFAASAAGTTLAERQAAVLAYSLGLQFGGLVVQFLVGVAFIRSFPTGRVPAGDTP